MSGITVRRTKNNLQNTCLIQKEMTFIHHWGYFECQLLGTQRCSHIPICQNVVFNDLWSNIMQIPSTASSLEDHSSVEIKRKKKKKLRKRNQTIPVQTPRYLIRAVMAQREDASQRHFWEKKKKTLGQGTDVLSFHF